MSQLLQQLRTSEAIDGKALDSALRRQQIYGGSLDTVLLELDLLSASVLNKQLGLANGCEPSPVALLEPGLERPWDALPKPLLDLGWAMPLRRHLGHIQVAIHPEIPLEQRNQLERSVEHMQVFVTCEACLAKLAAERRSSVIPQRYAVLALKWMQALKREQPEPEPAAPSAPWMSAATETAAYTVAPPSTKLPSSSGPVFKSSTSAPTMRAASPSKPEAAQPQPSGRHSTLLYGLPVDDDDDDDDLGLTTPVLEPEPAAPEPAVSAVSAPAISAPAALELAAPAPDEEDVPAPRIVGTRGAEPRRSASLHERLAGPRSALEDATQRDGATEALVRAAMVLSPRVALFGIKREGLRGLPSPGQIPEVVDQLVELEGKIEAAVEGQLTMDRVNDLDLRIAVGREMAAPCIFLPVRVHDRPVLMLYIDRDNDAFTDEEVEAARGLCEIAGVTLERVLRKIRGEPEDEPSVASAAPIASGKPSLFAAPSSLIPPGRFTPPGFKAPSDVRPSDARGFTPPPIAVAPPVAAPPVAPPAAAAIPSTPRPVTPPPFAPPPFASPPAKPPAVAAPPVATLTFASPPVASARVASQPVAAPRAASQPVASPPAAAIPPVRVAPPVGAAGATGATQPAPESAAKPPVRTTPPAAVAPPATAASTPSATPAAKPPVRVQRPEPAAEAPVPRSHSVSAPVTISVPGAVVPSPTSTGAPVSKPNLMSLSPPIGASGSSSETIRGRIQLDDEDRPRKADPRLQEIDTAIASALRGDSTAISRLRDIGEPALRRIAKQFPGELDVNRRDLDTLPPLPAHGGLIRVALEIGPELGPHLVEFIDHPNPAVRFYIAFVFMELRHELAVAALGELAFDPDADVRAIAMRVLETYSGEPGFLDTVKIIRRELDSPNRTRALHATRAIGTLRDIEAVAKLIDLLTSKERYIQEAALESLCSVTGQQLGLKPHRWESWYGDNAQNHRVEWIMSSLAHKDLSVRRWAADELRRITGQRINFLAAGSKQEREIGLRKWVEWWNDRGRAEFGGS